MVELAALFQGPPHILFCAMCDNSNKEEEPVDYRAEV